MITLLQQSLMDHRNFTPTKDINKATHYEKDGVFMGRITKEFITNVLNEGHYEEPLVMPTINFGEEKTDKNSPEDNSNGETPLLMPKMEF